ncbi:MAG: OmpA family protein [Sphingomonas sp.]
MKRTTFLSRVAIAGLTLAAVATPALAQDRWDWHGGHAGDRDYRLEGRGVLLLLPELRETNRGRAFVMRNFDWNHDGLVNPREADAANRAFARVAGRDRRGFDWDRHDRVVIVDERPAPVSWDRGAMRGYGFRQTSRGAMMRLDDDVLFATDSDVLRPGAIDRLKPIANYLRANSGVRVAIDGYTDSRGSDAHNQALSERRAASVRGAFDAMGVTRARFSVAGHGEASPIATNATAEGMRQNRRVEVTLLGQRADRF